MEGLKLVRNTYITEFNNLITLFKEELAKPEVVGDVLKVKNAVIENQYSKICEYGSKILENFTTEFTAQQVAAEIKIQQDLEKSYQEYKLLFGTIQFPEAQTSSDGCDPIKLPEKIIKKFDGDIINWLPWWDSFQAIHNRTKTPETTKFDLLVDALEPNSRAMEVIKGYARTAENYQKAVAQLTRIFGDPEEITNALILSINRLLSNFEKISFVDLYYQLLTKIQELESLKVYPRSHEASPMLFPLVYNVLQESRKLRWKRHYAVLPPDVKVQSSKLRILLDWLQEEVIHDSSEESIRDRKRGRTVTLDESDATVAQLLYVSEKKPRIDYRRYCVFCDKPHPTQECYSGWRRSIEERKKILQDKMLCFVCFRSHRARDCQESVRCKICGQRHYQVMCHQARQNTASRSSQPIQFKRSETTWKRGQSDRRRTESNRSETKDQNQESAPIPKSAITVPTVSTAVSQDKGQVPLQTLICKLYNVESGQSIRARTLLDTGAQKSTITKVAVNALGLKSDNRICLDHKLYGGQSMIRYHNIYNLQVKSLDETFSTEIEVIDDHLIVQQVPDVAQYYDSVKHQGIVLTDIHGANAIDLLIGNDIYGKLLTGIKTRVGIRLTAIKTKLGYVLAGDQDEVENDTHLILQSLSMLSITNIKRLWDLEILGIRDPIQVKSQKELDEEVKAHFLKTVSINPEGRYEIELPWVRPPSSISCNYYHARKRLENATKKLIAQGLVCDYEKVFEEWMKLGIIEEVPVTQDNLSSGYFLPHRAVVKVASETTKIRPVFDASSITASSKSLNDCLAVGPNLIELIPDLIIGFRLRQFAAVSDIRKAFLQISVNEMDRDYLKFLWWESDGKTLKIFRHRRVVFGVNCSPFLLAAVIEKHLSNVKIEHAESAKTLLRSFYVDNSIVSFDSVIELQKFQRESVELMMLAKMELAMWKTSLDELAEDKTPVGVLGLSWDRNNDTLMSKIAIVDLPEIITMRSILSVAQSIFDPMGMMAPITLKPKIMMRQLHEAKVKWDDVAPAEIQKEFREWLIDIEQLRNMSIQRRISTIPLSTAKSVEVHVFGDASKVAYAVASYIVVHGMNTSTVNLIQAKARVAPQNATIPRLELLASQLAARIGNSILNALRKYGVEASIKYWSDSKVVLTWIRQDNNWGTFINNRVTEIRKLTSICDWKFVPGTENPSDLPSRGCNASKLLQSNWLIGPNWLQNEQLWPVEADAIHAESNLNVVDAMTDKITDAWYMKHTEFEKNVRLVAEHLNSNSSAKLSVEDLEKAEIELWKYVQRDTDVKERMGRLSLTLNAEGLYCVKTRLMSCDELKDLQLPVYLPSNHALVLQYIMKVHLRNAHASEGVMICKLRKQFWIPGVRPVVRNVLRKCMKCARFTTKKVQVPIAPLPKDRLLAERCFEVTGVDLGGPLLLKDGTKVWFVIFTCAVFRAVHLEIVSSLSTKMFIMALRRFISRRNRPVTMYSDQGTNFIGLENAMADLNWDEIQKETAIDRIKWKLNPPTAPWWGGWWERLVGIVKQLLKCNLGREVVDFEELSTVLCDIEYVMNQRPLTKHIGSNDEFGTLTPQMFLTLSANIKKDQNDSIGSSQDQGVAVADLDLIDAKRLSIQFDARKSIMNKLRERFVNEYIADLAEFAKKIPKSEIKVDDLVLVGSDNQARVYWPVAKVTTLIPGKDGICRLAFVKIKIGKQIKEIMRPVQRLYPLELDTSITEGVNLNEILHFTENQTGETGTETHTQNDGDDISPAAGDCRVENEVTQHRSRSGRLIKKPERLIELFNGMLIIDDEDD